MARTCDGGHIIFGTVFSVPVGGGPVTTLASFNGTNGSNPFGGLILSGSNFYGTTEKGGAHNFGTVFAIPAWGGPVTTLASFTEPTGRYPEGELTLSGSTCMARHREGGPYNGWNGVFNTHRGGSVNTLAWFKRRQRGYPPWRIDFERFHFVCTTYQGGAYGNNPGAHEYGLWNGFLNNTQRRWVGEHGWRRLTAANGEFPGGGLTLSGSTLYGTTEKGRTWLWKRCSR